jgi:hypothetical protein
MEVSCYRLRRFAGGRAGGVSAITFLSLTATKGQPMTAILNRMLSGDVKESETTAEDRLYIDTLRKRRLVVRYTGPGPAWYRLTGQGRVVLSDTQASRPEPMF